MIFALVSQTFNRAFLSGRFNGDKRALRKAAQLAEQHFIDGVHRAPETLALVGIHPHRGVTGQIFVYPNGRESLFDQIKRIEAANEHVSEALHLRSELAIERAKSAEAHNELLKDIIAHPTPETLEAGFRKMSAADQNEFARKVWPDVLKNLGIE